jgi:hypothetical protein
MQRQGVSIAGTMATRNASAQDFASWRASVTFAHVTPIRRPARPVRQPSGFAHLGSLVDERDEHPGEDFIQGIWDELHATLALARRSTTFPWRDLTQTYMVEMRFNSMSKWLQRQEAAPLRRQFAAEMDRLYEAADQERPEAAGADF